MLENHKTERKMDHKLLLWINEMYLLLKLYFRLYLLLSIVFFSFRSFCSREFSFCLFRFIS